MNIVLGYITPEEFLFYLTQQIDYKFPDGRIRRIIIDELKVIDYCFPMLKRDPLFLPAVVDECRTRGIALFILCDINSELTGCIRTLADNVVCMQRTETGTTKILIEKYSGYNAKSSKIFAGEVKEMEALFECYDKGSRDTRKTYFDFDSDYIIEKKVYSMFNFWKSTNK